MQSETKLTSQLKLILAGRADNHNYLNDIVLSPRAALAFQPNDDHNLRLTYNRAFSTPGTSNLFLDRIAVENLPGLGIDIRAQGVPAETGYTFKRLENGSPLFHSPFLPGKELPVDANAVWGLERGLVMSGFEAGLKETFTAEALPQIAGGLPPEAIQGLVPKVVNGLPPETLKGLLPQVIQGLPPAVLGGLPPELAPLLQPGAIAALPAEQLQQIVPQLVQGIPPEVLQGLLPQILQGLPGPVKEGLAASMVADLSNGFAILLPEQIDGVDTVLRSLNPETQEFVDRPGVKDVDPLKPTITQTYEFGYKGILMNKLAFSADVYHTRIKDFVGPLVVETPNVFLDAETLTAALAERLTTVLSDPQNASLNQALITAFDTPNPDDPTQGGNGDGSAVDDLIRTFASIPAGTVTPEQVTDPTAIMLTYRNYGDISLNGLDCSLTYYLNPSLSIGGNYSFVSKNIFENELNDIALNAPKNKFGVNVQYINANLGLGAGGPDELCGWLPCEFGGLHR